jgi:FkbM family methyltransferase
MSKPGVLADAFVGFYRVWHGRLRMKGAGYLLQRASRYVSGLQQYPLQVRGVGIVPVDLRDYAGRLWLQHLLGDSLAPFDLEDGLSRSMAAMMKKDTVVWDVGANVGMVTAALTTAFPHSRIFTFEPNPFLFQSLETLFAGHSNVTILPYALSDEDGDALLTIPRGKSVGASIKGFDYVLQTANLTENDVVQTPVRAVRGDSLLQSEDGVLPPQVIKIDVEGHEAAVLCGLAGIISRYRPVIFFEHLYLSDEEVSRLVPPGYMLQSVANTDGRLTDGFDRSAGHNSVLIPATQTKSVAPPGSTPHA